MFEDIKVGDKVLAIKKVKISWNTFECFFVGFKVKRVTAKRFIIDGINGQFKKSDGQLYGGHYADKCKPYTKEDDQTEQCRWFIRKFNVKHKIAELCDKIKLISYNDDNLFEVLTLLENCDDLIG